MHEQLDTMLIMYYVSGRNVLRTSIHRIGVARKCCAHFSIDNMTLGRYIGVANLAEHAGMMGVNLADSVDNVRLLEDVAGAQAVGDVFAGLGGGAERSPLRI
jgi:hypothetical protein